MSSDFSAILAPDTWFQKGAGPRYRQLQLRLENLIANATLPPGTPLPAEREIAAITEMSRVTVRKAIQGLVAKGQLAQKQGSGSYVAEPQLGGPTERSLAQLTSFTEELNRRGRVSDSVTLRRGTFAPSPDEIIALGLSAGETVTRIDRVRRADGNPIALEYSSVSSDILPNAEAVRGSLYEWLTAHGLRPCRAIQRISASNLDAEQAAHLNVAPGVAALRIVRTGYLETGRAIELTSGVYLGEAHDFIVELKGPPI